MAGYMYNKSPNKTKNHSKPMKVRMGKRKAPKLNQDFGKRKGVDNYGLQSA